MYIIEGPARIANVFGYAGKTVPAGKFAIVAYSEFANGGFGPCQAVKGLWDSREAAEAVMARVQAKEAPR